MGTAHTHHMEATSHPWTKFRSWCPEAHTRDKTQQGMKQGGVCRGSSINRQRVPSGQLAWSWRRVIFLPSAICSQST